MKLSNFSAFPCSITSPATADTAFTVSHGCERDGVPTTPRGLLIVRRYHAAQLYYDPASWTTTQATLTATVGGATFETVFFT